MLPKNNRYLIYKFESPSGKCYIGMTSRPLKVRVYNHVKCALQGSNLIFHRAIRKYGIENFKCEILKHELSYKEACDAEIYFIAYYKSQKPTGYNITSGGDGWSGVQHSDKTKKLLSDKAKAQWNKDRDVLLKKLAIVHYKTEFAVKKYFSNMSPDDKKEFKSKVSEGCKKFWATETGRLLISSRKPIADLVKKRISITLKSRIANPITHEKAIENCGATKIRCIETGVVFESQAEAERQLGIRNINYVLRGRRSNAGGYTFEYVDASKKTLKFVHSITDKVIVGQSIANSKNKLKFGVNFNGFRNTVDNKTFKTGAEIRKFYNIKSSAQITAIINDGRVPLKYKGLINIEVLYNE